MYLFWNVDNKHIQLTQDSWQPIKSQMNSEVLSSIGVYHVVSKYWSTLKVCAMRFIQEVYPFVLNREVLSLSSHEYKVIFVRECFTPQYRTSGRESEFSRTSMWIPFELPLNTELSLLGIALPLNIGLSNANLNLVGFQCGYRTSGKQKICPFVTPLVYSPESF